MLAKAPGGLAAGTEYAKGQCPTKGEVLSVAGFILLGDGTAQTAELEFSQGNMSAAPKLFLDFMGQVGLTQCKHSRRNCPLGSLPKMV